MTDNTDIIDEVAFDSDHDELVLILHMNEPWDDLENQLTQLKDRIANYTRFALGGQLVEAFPEHQGKKVRVQLDCQYLTPEPLLGFLEQVNEILNKGGARLAINCAEANNLGH